MMPVRCAATFEIGGKLYHCKRHVGTLRGGQPVPHSHHEWSRAIRGAVIKIEWEADSATPRLRPVG